MPTPDELRDQLAAAREDLRNAIEAAGPKWEASPGGDEWSARQVAEHVIPTEVFFANAVCQACGYPGPESPFGERAEFATSAAALEGLQQAVDASNAKIKYVTPEDLEHKHERMGSVADVMAFNVQHLREHADQLQVLANA